MRKPDFDPISYIDQAFLDLEQEQPEKTSFDAPQPVESSRAVIEAIRSTNGETPKVRLKTTKMKAPRPRRRRTPANDRVIQPEIEAVWRQLPKNLKFLASVYDDGVTQKYYTGGFKESRSDLIMRLVDPQLNLEETARLLGVCPATVRRYTNRGWLTHHRTEGNQRRFRLSGIVSFVEEHGRNPE
jgi:excisionase family DNA binding protein